jgi:hypothetical protein
MGHSLHRHNLLARGSWAAASAVVIATITGCGGGGGPSSQPTTSAPSAPGVTPSPTPTPTPTPSPTPSPPPGDPMVSPLMIASNWEIGPIIDGKNYSVGMPLHPVQTNDGWAFDFPLKPGKVGYVTFRYGSLSGKSHIVMRYRVELDPDVQLFPTCCSELPAQGPTVYFQQRNDDWNTDGMRWWATFNSPFPIRPGEREVDIPLDGAWTSVFKMTAASNLQQFVSAKVNADRVGFTFGGGDGYGHGVYANGNARFVVTSFKIE